MSKTYNIPTLPLPYDLETKIVLKELGIASRKLAELKGVAHTIPNENILISTLTLQEARDSSSIENIITTQDDLYKADLNIRESFASPATKEVQNYREAISVGFKYVRAHKILTNNYIIEIQKSLKHNDEGFRSAPGTVLKNDADGSVVYEPPQDHMEIVRLMQNLEKFINDNQMCDYDPLIKMAIIHHQFESIHPFGDGNGRTGRIINILYLVQNDLLDLPILYLSRYITHNKAEYYRLIQAIRDKNIDNAKEWEDWIIFMLRGVAQTADETISLIKAISQLMGEYKAKLRPAFGNKYKHELLNNLFFHPYTKIGFMERDAGVQRLAAAKYLNKIVDLGLLHKIKIGRENLYINEGLVDLFYNASTRDTKIES